MFRAKWFVAFSIGHASFRWSTD